MDVLYSVLSWGSPVGLALFFSFSAGGVGILFWGISRLQTSNKSEKKEQEEQSGHRFERVGR